MKEKDMDSRIKVLATLGPTSMARSKVWAMDREGVDIFRVNLSHTPVEKLAEIIEAVTSWTSKPFCVDTEGAQIRTGKMAGAGIVLKRGSSVSFATSSEVGSESVIPLYPSDPSKILRVGDVVHLDFNSAVIQVTSVASGGARGRVLAGGYVGSNKGVSLDRRLSLPAFTDKDLRAFEIAKKYGLKYVAFSFASRKEDVEWLRSFFGYEIFVISKVESSAALENLSSILEVSDAILIDRGDLSRDVDIWKIGLAQKYITQRAEAAEVPTYVATNLLESMFNNLHPTRAEINDVTNTLLNGASGLVLAAETAIGKYPVESVRMIRQTIREVLGYTSRTTNLQRMRFIRMSSDGGLIAPHGGTLVEQLMPSGLTEWDWARFPRFTVDDKIALDVQQIIDGVYTPIRHFMGKDELDRVLDTNHCADGVVWTMPILLQTDEYPNDLRQGELTALYRRTSKDPIGLIRIANVEEIDLESVAHRWFGTNDVNHPGVAWFKKQGKFIISGEVFSAGESSRSCIPYYLTPRQARYVFSSAGWRTVVAFHTRNLVHAGHAYIQKEALDQVHADALFISPVIGPKKAGDFSAEVVLGAYETILRSGYYEPYPAVMGVLNTYPRYSGPREAVFTALCRKNFGCSHFIVGRDHTGVGNFYAPNSSQEIFGKLGDIGIQPIFFDAAYYCQACSTVTMSCEHPHAKRSLLSATQVRDALLKKEPIPTYLVAQEIESFLREFEMSGQSLFER